MSDAGTPLPKVWQPYMNKLEQRIKELEEQVLHGKSLEELQRVMRENDELNDKPMGQGESRCVSG